MLDPIDYKEPRCAFCDGKEFYYPDKNAPKERIPVDRIIRKLDALFDKNDMTEAGRLLESWLREAVSFNDKDGELTIQSEMMGYYRKVGDKEKGIASVRRGLALVEELGLSGSVSAATITLNAATTLKAFDKADEAVPLYESALATYKKLLEDNDARFAGLYNNYALALVDLGRCEEAEELYLKALEIVKKTKNGGADAAVTYVNMAHMYETRGAKNGGDYENEIEKCLDSALKELNDEKLERNGYYAYVCSKCAPSFGYFGYFLADGDLKKRAEEIYARN